MRQRPDEAHAPRLRAAHVRPARTVHAPSGHAAHAPHGTTLCPGDRAAPRPRASPGARARTDRDAPEHPSSRSSSARAAVPIALIMRPPEPTTMPFCESLSTQISARTRASPGRGCSISSTTTSTAWGTSWRVRLITASRTSSPSSSASGWSERSCGANMNGPSGIEAYRCSTSAPHAEARARRDREHLAVQLQRARLLQCRGGRRAVEPVDLVDRDRRRGRGACEHRGDEPVARPHPLLAVEDQQRHVGSFELALHASGHALGQRVAWTLDPRKVDQHDLAVRPRAHSPDRPARRLRAVGDDRHLLPHHGVHERRLADVRAPRQGDEAAASPGHDDARYVSPSSWVCSASISPSSIS